MKWLAASPDLILIGNVLRKFSIFTNKFVRDFNSKSELEDVLRAERNEFEQENIIITI